MSKIAYKGFKVNDNNQLQCRDMIYELDKEYVIDGNLKLCENGMHFCWDIKDISPYYSLRRSTICEVEILGDVLEDYDKACTNKLKILRIMDKDEVMEITNEGSGNIGYFNKGNNNKGFRNKGNNNEGDYNTGDGNKGVWNKGDNNTGSRNRGNNITGFFNTINDIGSLDDIALFNKLSNISMEEFKQMEVYETIINIIAFQDITSCFMEDFICTLPNFDKDILDELY